MITRLLLPLWAGVLWALAGGAFAGTTSAILTGTTVVAFTTADSSCANLKTQFALTAGRVLLACSADPVIVGTTLLFTNTATNPRTVNITTVSAQTSTAPATPYPAAQAPEFQSASVTWDAAQTTAAVAAIPPSGASASQITVASAFGTATPDQYSAMGLVFGLILCAGAVIWGVKRVLFLFSHSSES